MKFTVDIKLGNSGMETVWDVAQALEKLSKNLANMHNLGYEPSDPLGGHIQDLNGLTVGSWDFEDDEEKKEERVCGCGLCG